MGAQRDFERRQVMARRRSADHGEAFGHDPQVADAVRGQFEALGGLLACQHDLDAPDRLQASTGLR